MNFSKRLLISLLVPAVFVFAAGGMVAVGTMIASQKVMKYFSTTDAFATSSAEMYTQGLQMGQALRNIVMDPDNAKAYDNLESASKSWDTAEDSAMASAPNASVVEKLNQIKTLSTQLVEIHKRVVSLAKQKSADAQVVLVKEETPTWRKTREILLDLKKSSTSEKNEVQRNGLEMLNYAGIFVAILSLICGGACVGFLLWIRRIAARTLGGDPASAQAALTKIAHGDLKTAVLLAVGDKSSLMASIEDTRASLVSIVSNVRESAQQIQLASAEIAQGNQDLSSRTEQQASALEETAASMEELGSTVQGNAQVASQANRLAAEASAVALQGGDVVHQVVETMKGINESSRKISEIISVIDGIAFQTNILALNAAVEAARAGEQGRGFAVVASEVRSLAGRSADAAKEIKTLINTSVERVEQGTMLVDKAGETMNRLLTSIKRVTDLMIEISASSNEQAAGVSQVGETVKHMDNATQKNAALVEEMAAAASSLNSLAQELVQTVATFKFGEQG